MALLSGLEVRQKAGWFRSAVVCKTNLVAVLGSNRTWVAATRPMSVTEEAMTGATGRIWVAGRDEGSASVEGAVCQWNGAEWTRLEGAFTGQGFSGALVRQVSFTSLALFQDQLFVGGHFTNISGRALSYLACWKGQSWEPAAELDGPVTGMAAGDRLYVVGNFKHADRREANGVTVWDGRQWSSLGNGLTNAAPYSVTISPEGAVTVLARFLDRQPPSLSSSVLVWRENRWESPGTFDGVLTAASLWLGRDLYMVGDFRRVNDQDSPGLAIWHEPGAALHGPKVSASAVELNISGAVPARTVLERSEGLAGWTGVSTNTFGIPGQKLYDRSERPSQFYRLRWLE